MDRVPSSRLHVWSRFSTWRCVVLCVVRKDRKILCLTITTADAVQRFARLDTTRLVTRAPRNVSSRPSFVSFRRGQQNNMKSHHRSARLLLTFSVAQGYLERIKAFGVNASPRRSNGQKIEWLSAGPARRIDDRNDDFFDNEDDAQRAEDDSVFSPVTPCVRICRYNSEFYEGAVCIGCFRETFEIGNWASFTEEEKVYALQDALDRWDGDAFPGSVSKEELDQQLRNAESQYRKIK